MENDRISIKCCAFSEVQSKLGNTQTICLFLPEPALNWFYANSSQECGPHSAVEGVNEDLEKIVGKNLSQRVKLLKLFNYLNALIIAPKNCDVLLQSIKNLPAQVIR